MLLQDPDDPLFQDLSAFVTTLGLALVELVVHTKNGLTQVQIVLHSSQGLGIDECAKAHRQLMPRLEALLATENFSMEVSSPGLQRVLKHQRELALFQGKKVKLYLTSGSDWERGILGSVTESTVEFTDQATTRVIGFEAIRKAKLDEI